MRIVIDLQGAQAENRHRGIGRYSLSFALALAKARGSDEVVVALNGALPDTIDPLRAAFEGIVPQDRIVVWDAPAATHWLDAGNAARRRQAEQMREAFLLGLDPDWLLLTSVFEGIEQDAVTSIAAFRHSRTAAVLYDLIPWIYPDLYLAHEPVRSWYLNKLDHLKRADLLLAISQSSADEARRYLGFEAAKVRNISTACDPGFRPQPLTSTQRDELAAKYGLKRKFLMYTGGIDHRKNVEALIKALARIPRTARAEYQLAIVCSIREADRNRLKELARAEGLANDQLAITGFVPEGDLRLLYNACTLFVFPSWHEGFGLPALEAMSCRKPVLASDRASLPEVVGNDKALFDPYDLEGMSAKIGETLADPKQLESLAASGLEHSKQFSWDRTAARAWESLRSGSPTRDAVAARRPHRRRPRLAFVSPLPPDKSGIADYSAELVGDLSRWYDIDVVLPDPAALGDPYVKAACGVQSVEAFRQNASCYDRVMYHFGNSPFHDHMFGLLEEIPGVVVLHDFYLSGVQQWGELHGPRPHAWTRALQAGHGYSAAVLRFRDPVACDAKFPANLPVLQNAIGLIAHSDLNKRLAQEFFGPDAGRGWATIPLLRVFEVEIRRSHAREKLGLSEDAFVVCSFGLLGEHKQNHRLLDAWNSAEIAKDRAAHLVFVGDAGKGSYGASMERGVAAVQSGSTVRVTGWVDHDMYRTWLAAADVAVQLRSNSRGETSAAVLDCMNFGLATVVNAHGSMAELDHEAVWVLPDEFTDGALAKAIDTLRRDVAKRQKLGTRARAVIRDLHSPRACAQQYFEAVERFYAAADVGAAGLVRELARALPAQPGRLVESLARNHPPSPRKRQLLVDISELVQRDSRSGIQRVVRSILAEWLRDPPDGFQVEPVYASPEAKGYRFARRFTARFLDIPDSWAEDAPVEAWPGDLFVGLDLQHHVVQAQRTVLQQWRDRGVKVAFVVYDLLPILLPDYFPGMQRLHHEWLASIAEFDALVAISGSVAQEAAAWLETVPTKRQRPLQIGWFHLGADIEQSTPSLGVPDDAAAVIATIRSRPSFLMVGTIEPRKGYAQTLAAFEQLWAAGEDVNLVLVGKEGWSITQLAQRIRQHPESGRRLFWLEAISDEYLQQVYAAATCLISASEGEGFGLPLIESARHGLPILARDIPVFREVAGTHASYFDNSLSSDVVAAAVSRWLSEFRAKRHPDPHGLTFLSWKQSATQLFETVLRGERCITVNPRDHLPVKLRGNDIRMLSAVGKRRGESMVTDGRAGYLLYGPYQPLDRGTYIATIRGESDACTGDERVDIACQRGNTVLLEFKLHGLPGGEFKLEGQFVLQVPVEDFEIRVLVSDGTRLSISSIQIRRA